MSEIQLLERKKHYEIFLATTLTSEDYLEVIKSVDTKSPLEMESFLKTMEKDTCKSIMFSTHKTAPISVLNREYPDFYLKSIKLMLGKILVAMNTREGLTKAQINIIPSMMFPEFGHYRLNMINMVVNGIITGRYKIYERVDVETFFRCLREFDASDEWITAREQYNQQQHQNKQQACETFKQFPKEVQEAFTKKKEKPLDTSAIIPMNFATDKDSMKKIRIDGKEK